MDKKLNYFTAIKFLSRYIKKHRRNFCMFYLGWLFQSSFAISLPILFGIMIDEVVYYQNLLTFTRISLIFITFTISSCVLYFLIYVQHGYLMNMFVFNIRKDIFGHLQKCDAEYLTTSDTGELIASIQNYSSECMHFIVRNMIHMTNEAILIIVYGIYLLVIDWRIGLVALLTAPLSTFINSKYGKKIRNYGDEQRKYYGGYISWMFEIISALRDVKMLGAKKKTEEMFEQNHKNMFAVNIKSGISNITAENVISFSNLAIRLVIFTIAGYSASSGNMTVGVLTIIVSFYSMLSINVSSVSDRYLDSQNRISYIQRIHDFMKSPTDDEWLGKKTIDITNGKIQFSDITFAYNERHPVINNLNLTINAGERFAIIGKSGCGKTTLAYMLIGFYRPQNGYIEIDGQKLSECNLKSIRQSVGLVQQDVLIFDGTIRENILLGNLHTSHDKLINACQSAGLLEFIESLPDKLDTVIGSKGIGVSGGQKQRIAIARIYLKNPQIIIFDEATSSLDSETEEAIHEAWQEVLAGRTAIIIAHRQSSVMLCEQAAIIEDGHIVETGNPAEMVKTSEKFKTLFAIREGVQSA
jgi:ATP-binding cassette, subfamily B, bacterial